VRFEILGPVAAHRGDEDVTPRGSLQRRLLAALLMAAPHPVAVDALVEVLWPAGAPSANALQAQVSKLRRAVAPVPIESGPAGYALVAPIGSIDRERLENELEWAADAVSTEPAAVAARLGVVRAAVRGEPLDELADVDLARAERTRLTLLLEALDTRRLEALVAAGDATGALPELEALVATQQLDEHLWALLMKAQYMLGRQADALGTYRRARRVLAEELGVEPGPELEATQRLVLDHDPALGAGRPPRTRRHRVPARLSSFVGRADLVAAIDDRLAASRLVTLLGPGGVGKTTSAMEALRDRPGVVEIVELAPLLADDPADVMTAVLTSLGGIDSPPNATRDELSLSERVIGALAGAPTTLLVDNCEHIVGAAAKVVHELLEACPELRVVATSREALGVPGEHVVPVPPLDEEPAIELFVQRAAAAGGKIEIERDRPVIAEVVSRLDGLPLAIELAAARTRSLTAQQLRDRLDDRFAVLARGPRTVDRRQQTLRDVVDWSHALLDEAEQRVLRRLSAFEGGASLDGAQAVCGDDEVVLAAEVEVVVERLIDKSLVVTDRRADEIRFRMLETIQSYARERLGASGEQEAVLLRHAGWFAALVEQAGRGITGADQRRWLDVLAVERENHRAALDVALAYGDATLALRLTAPLGWYTYVTGQFELGAQMLDDALGCPGHGRPADRALALAMYGWLLANGPDLERARSAADEALLLLADVDDGWVETLVLACWMMVSFFLGDLDAVRSTIDDARAAAARADDPWSSAMVELVRGEILDMTGDGEHADEAFATAAAGFERVGDHFAYSICLGEAAAVAGARGDYDRAAGLLARAIESAESKGFSSHPIALRASLANVEILRGDLLLAERMHLEVLEALEGQPFQWLRTISWTGLAMIERRRGDAAAAQRWLDEAWELRRTQKVPHMQALVLVAQGFTADMRGDGATALALQLRGLDISLEIDNPRGVAYSLEGVAGALAALDGAQVADLGAQLLGRADAIRRRSGGPMPAAERFDVDRAEARLRGRLGPAAFERAVAAGADASNDELIAAVGAATGGR